ncbi:hypothetical protein D3C81_765610 [compost metagenome]
MCHRATLAPARHTPVNQLRVTGQQHLWSQSETLHHARSHAFDQCVRAFDQFQYGLAPFGCFQIGYHGTLATIHRVFRSVLLARNRGSFTPLNGYDLCSQVCQMHGAKRPRTDAADFYNLDVAQHEFSLDSSSCALPVGTRITRPGPARSLTRHSLVEDNHRTRQLAATHLVEGDIDVFEFDALRNHLVEFEPTLHIEVGQARQIDRKTVRTHN